MVLRVPRNWWTWSRSDLVLRSRHLAVGLTLLACTPGGSEPAPALSQPRFELRLSGAEERALSGRAFAAPTVAEGLIELDPVTGTLTSRPRTPVLFYPSDLAQPEMLTIDLIGVLEPTSYAAYADGDYARRTHFLSTYSMRRPNGLARHFLLSSGTVVITAVHASHITGTVAIQFGGYIDPVPGSAEQTPMVPAPLSITGTFTAAFMPGARIAEDARLPTP
jgi:hypothetical protein